MVSMFFRAYKNTVFSDMGLSILSDVNRLAFQYGTNPKKNVNLHIVYVRLPKGRMLYVAHIQLINIAKKRNRTL